MSSIGKNNFYYSKELPLKDPSVFDGSNVVTRDIRLPTSTLSEYVRYGLVGSTFEVRVTRDNLSQLITVELLSTKKDQNLHSYGKWQISAYQTDNESITAGAYTVKISLSPFSFSLKFFQRTIGFTSEVASLIIKPKVLRPGDIPVLLNGAWTTDGANSYEGRGVTDSIDQKSTRYNFENSNLEVSVSKMRSTGDLLLKLTLRDDRGVRQQIASWALSNLESKQSTFKVGQYTVKTESDSRSFGIKFLDKTLGLIPTEIGYLGVDLSQSKHIGAKTVPVMLSGTWSEQGLNFDRNFAV